jgi:hypothetical protein
MTWQPFSMLGGKNGSARLLDGGPRRAPPARWHQALAVVESASPGLESADAPRAPVAMRTSRPASSAGHRTFVDY